MIIGPGSSIVPPKQRVPVVSEMRLYGTPVLLVIAESANYEVSQQALAILRERGLDEKSSAAEWAAAWKSTNDLRVADLSFAAK
jgi:hypothetical protein